AGSGDRLGFMRRVLISASLVLAACSTPPTVIILTGRNDNDAATPIVDSSVPVDSTIGPDATDAEIDAADAGTDAADTAPPIDASDAAELDASDAADATLDASDAADAFVDAADAADAAPITVCPGEAYDGDGVSGNGCETQDSPTDNHT